MKNILLTIDSLENGGAEGLVLTLAKRLSAARYRVVVAVPLNSWMQGALDSAHIPYIGLQFRGSFDINYLKQIKKIVVDNDIDLIHSHLFGSNIYCSIVGILSGIPVVSTFHGAMDVGSGEKFLWLKSLLIRKGSRCTVFVSEYLRRELAIQLGLSKEQTIVVYNGIDTERYRAFSSRLSRVDLGVSDDTFLLGAVGHIRPWKGYETLFRALGMLRDSDFKFRFVLVGGDNPAGLDSLKQLRADLRLDEEIVFLGSRDDVPDILRLLDLYVLSSVSEGFSLSTVEAMLCGAPVVVTRCGGPEEIVEDGKTGWVVPVDSERDLAQIILRAANNPIVTARFADRAAQVARSRFGLQAMLDSYYSIYETALISI